MLLLQMMHGPYSWKKGYSHVPQWPAYQEWRASDCHCQGWWERLPFDGHWSPPIACLICQLLWIQSWWLMLMMWKMRLTFARLVCPRGLAWWVVGIATLDSRNPRGHKSSHVKPYDKHPESKAPLTTGSVPLRCSFVYGEGAASWHGDALWNCNGDGACLRETFALRLSIADGSPLTCLDLDWLEGECWS